MIFACVCLVLTVLFAAADILYDYIYVYHDQQKISWHSNIILAVHYLTINGLVHDGISFIVDEGRFVKYLKECKNGFQSNSKKFTRNFYVGFILTPKHVFAVFTSTRKSSLWILLVSIAVVIIIAIINAVIYACLLLGVSVKKAKLLLPYLIVGVS